MSTSRPAAYPGAGSPGFRVPSLGYRILMAGLRLIPSFLILIAIPAAALSYLSSRGIALPISVFEVTLWGALLLALGAAQYILKPTVAYGPTSIAYSAVALAYLYYVVTISPYRFTLPGGSASIAAGYSSFLELLMIVPAIGVLVGILTTVEDVRSPSERLPFDYPI